MPGQPASEPPAFAKPSAGWQTPAGKSGIPIVAVRGIWVRKIVRHLEPAKRKDNFESLIYDLQHLVFLHTITDRKMHPKITKNWHTGNEGLTTQHS